MGGGVDRGVDRAAAGRHVPGAEARRALERPRSAGTESRFVVSVGSGAGRHAGAGRRRSAAQAGGGDGGGEGGGGEGGGGE